MPSYSDRTIARALDVGHYGSTTATNVPALVDQQNQRFVVYGRTTAEASATDFADTILLLDRAARLISAKLIPWAALTANDSNYNTYTLGFNDGAGGSVTALASITTSATGGGGSWTVSATAGGTVKSLTQSGAQDIASGKAIQLAKTHTGTGITGVGFSIELVLQEV